MLKQKLDHERQQKQDEFQLMLERRKLEKQTTLEIKHLEAARQVVNPPVPQDNSKKHIPRLPPLSAEDSLPIFVGWFSDSMTATQIPACQWVSRLRDILHLNR